jgi:tetratricopeptide (TPR) repeat protein
MKNTAWHVILISSLLAGFLPAQTLVLKNGQTNTGKSFRREDDKITITAEIAGPDGKMMTAERSVALSEIERVEAEMPVVLKNAPALLSTGKATAVLSELLNAEKAAEPFGELTGSWWPQIVVLRAHVLLALGKDAEAAVLAAAFEKSANAELKGDAQAVQAVIAARKGDHATATPLAVPLLKSSSRASTIAAASLARGLGHMAKKEHTEALKAFLELPVFTPEETALAAAAQLGAAQAYYGLEDYDRAISTAEDLIKKRATSPEAAAAQKLLPEWKRRRTAVNEANEP